MSLYYARFNYVGAIMRRPIAWQDKECEEGRREVRVTFHGETIKWQFLPAGSRDWIYDQAPTEENWKQLEEKLANLWQRGHTCKHEMELAKRRAPAPDDQYKKREG